MNDMRNLQEGFTLVTGGSREVAKGVAAQELGDLGATVCVTGGTVDQIDVGDECIRVVCEHTDDLSVPEGLCW